MRRYFRLCAFEVMAGGKYFYAREHILHRVRKCVVRQMHIGKQGVFTRIRCFFREKECRLCWMGAEHLVRMPRGADGVVVARLFQNSENFRICIESFHVGMMVDVTKLSGKFELLLRRDVLIVKYDNMMT